MTDATADILRGAFERGLDRLQNMPVNPVFSDDDQPGRRALRAVALVARAGQMSLIGFHFCAPVAGLTFGCAARWRAAPATRSATICRSS